MIVASEEKAKKQIKKFEDTISDMSKQEMRELLLINIYKINLLRSQVETLSEILIKNKLATYEEIWKKTDENFKNSTM